MKYLFKILDEDNENVISEKNGRTKMSVSYFDFNEEWKIHNEILSIH